jgi:signal transduction histidine kinase/HD-like signal output (HDOD) protein
MDEGHKLKLAINLPALPHVLLKLMEACNDEDSTVEELTEIIVSDSALAGKVISIGNSAYYGVSGKHSTVDRIILQLGRNMIKNLAISASVLEAFGQVKTGPDFRLESYWGHCFLCAALARQTAMAIGFPQKEEAFLAGLLHDIGKLVLLSQPGMEYAKILKELDGGPNLAAAERARLGIDHAEAGNLLLERDGFSSIVADAVLYHHEAEPRLEDAFDLSKIIFMANLISHAEDAPTHNRGIQAAGTFFGLTPGQAEELYANAKKEAASTAESLGITLAEPEQAEPTPPKRERRKELVGAVRNQALLIGTLNPLMEADSRERILSIIHQGARILFNLRQVITFLYEPATNKLAAAVPPEHELFPRIQHLKILEKHSDILAVRSFHQNRVIHSFDPEFKDGLTIADEQIRRLFKTDGLICLPISARREPLGVIVAGVDAEEAPDLAAQGDLVTLFTNQVGLCLHLQTVKENQTMRIVQERMEASAAMARIMVHETNNPLGIIGNYINVLSRKLGPREDVLEELGILKEEVERIRQIIRKMTLVSPTQSNPAPLGLNKIVQDIVRLLDSSVLDSSGVKVQLNLASDLPLVSIDGGKLIQVITNLVKNAVEAMPEGGKMSLTTRLSEDRGRVLLIIRDDGPGLPEQVRARIFEPQQTTKGGDHFGLGLSIVRNLVTEMKGSIECRTSEQTGTAFIISLPMALDEGKLNGVSQ